MITSIKVLFKAEKVVLYLYNRDIDHLYSMSMASSDGNNQKLAATMSTFGLDTIRMKASLG